MPLGVSCDTSVLLPALTPWHQFHDVARIAVETEVTVVIAHVLAETFSTSSRLPEPFRASAGTVLEALRRVGKPVVGLTADKVLPTLSLITAAELSGGATYDALIAACATEHDLELLTLDMRAARTYRAIGVQVRYLA